MYAIKQSYTSHAQPSKSFCRVLKKRYKTYQWAEKAAKNFRWICLPNGVKGVSTEESSAEVVTLN